MFLTLSDTKITALGHVLISPSLRVLINMSLLVNVSGWIIEISDHLKTQEMCNKAMRIEPLLLAYVPDHFKTQEMCIKVLEKVSWMLRCVSDHLKTHGMCERATEKTHRP